MEYFCWKKKIRLQHSPELCRHLAISDAPQFPRDAKCGHPVDWPHWKRAQGEAGEP